MSVQSTIIKNVILKHGEPFVLPAGAVVKTVIGTVTSSGCSLPESEDYNCYVVYFGTAKDGTPSSVYKEIYINGIMVNDTKYTFDTIVVTGAEPATQITTSLENAIKSIGLYPMMKDFCGNYDAVGTKGSQYNIVFKTVPSITTNMYLIGRALSFEPSPNNDLLINFPVVTYSSASDVQTKCPCEL